MCWFGYVHISNSVLYIILTYQVGMSTLKWRAGLCCAHYLHVVYTLTLTPPVSSGRSEKRMQAGTLNMEKNARVSARCASHPVPAPATLAPYAHRQQHTNKIVSQGRRDPRALPPSLSPSLRHTTRNTTQHNKIRVERQAGAWASAAMIIASQAAASLAFGGVGSFSAAPPLFHPHPQTQLTTPPLPKE